MCTGVQLFFDLCTHFEVDKTAPRSAYNMLRIIINNLEDIMVDCKNAKLPTGKAVLYLLVLSNARNVMMCGGGGLLCNWCCALHATSQFSPRPASIVGQHIWVACASLSSVCPLGTMHVLFWQGLCMMSFTRSLKNILLPGLSRRAFIDGLDSSLAVS